MKYGNLEIGTTIKFKSWNDDLMVGVIEELDNGIYKVSVSSQSVKFNVEPNDVLEVINKTKFEPIYVEPIIEEPIIEEPIIEERKSEFYGIFANGGIFDMEKTDNLPNELTIYVPIFDSKDIPASDEEIEKRVNEVRDFLFENFDEYVIKKLGSSYIDSEGNLVMRKHIQLSAYPSDNDFKENKSKLINQISIWANEWMQESVLMEYEDDTFYILPLQDMMKRGGELWIQDAIAQMKKKGSVGAFTKQAKREGLTPIEFAKKVLAKPQGYTIKTRRRATFVKNVNPDKF
jgi:hypothetical protein